MPIAPARRGFPALLGAAAILFVILGIVLIPLAGIQDDEALFAAPLFAPPFQPYTLSIFGHHLPLMVFSYTGALKTYLYWPIFKLFAPGPYSLRVPVVLLGAVTIVAFYYFARRIAGPRAAMIAALVLACDPTFLLSNTFDWGPVALQHLLFVGGLCLIVSGNIAAACLIFGLALWEKSVFLWSIAGLVAAGWVVYRAEISAAVKGYGVLGKRKPATAAIAFLIGASPLIVYNIKSGNETVRTTAHFSLQHFGVKAEELKRALNGSGMFRFVAAESWESDYKPAHSLQAGIADTIHNLSGNRHSSLFPYAVALALLAAPFWWRTPLRKPAVFAIVCSAATFAAMAVTRDAGEAIHHTVLLWPMPQLLVGVALASIPWRWPGAMLAAVLIASNLLVVNQYIFQLDHYGADGGFTDALRPLSAQLPLKPGDKICLMDWGLTQTLTLLHRGKLPLVAAADPFLADAPGALGKQIITNLLNDPNDLFIGHVRGREVFTGAAERLEAAARAAGYHKQILQTVADSNRRPVFELYRFAK